MGEKEGDRDRGELRDSGTREKQKEGEKGGEMRNDTQYETEKMGGTEEFCKRRNQECPLHKARIEGGSREGGSQRGDPEVGLETT